MNKIIETKAQTILAGGQLDRLQIEELFYQSSSDLHDLLYWANKIRQHFFGNRIKICSIIPGRIGGCDQDCAFCANQLVIILILQIRAF